MRRLVLATCTALLLVTGCRVPATVVVTSPTTSTTHAPPTTQATPPTTHNAPPTTQAAPPTTQSAERTTTYRALRADAELPVFAHPFADEPFRVLPATTVLGTPTVVLVRESRTDGWERVSLPGRPNGAEGWIRSGELAPITGAREVHVDLAGRMLTVLEDGREIYSTTVAVGSSASPTPMGSFYITDAVALRDGSGPWGPFAFGLSARSDTITEFKGADGIIGIHGTNDPGSIGKAASLGCVRVHNDIIRELWELLSVGTPVTIRG